jgi:hypothetical protein
MWVNVDCKIASWTGGGGRTCSVGVEDKLRVFRDAYKEGCEIPDKNNDCSAASEYRRPNVIDEGGVERTLSYVES